MDVKNEISEELGSLSALVATISRENPYRVPDGYFSDLPVMILGRIVTPGPSPEPELPQLSRIGELDASKSLTFSVPDGYFDGLAQQVLSRIKAGAATDNAFDKAAAEPDELPVMLAQAVRITPYQVPEGYFEELSPVLAVLREKNPYTVPAGYFEHLAIEIGAKTTAETPAHTMTAAGSPVRSAAKVIGLGQRRTWWKYPAAAVVAGLILTVGWLRMQTSRSGRHDSRPGVVQPVPDIAQNLSKVSDQDLQNFLADQDTTLAQPIQNNATATLDMNDSDLKTLLGDVPDGELKQYMEEHGGAMDIATN
jgi:hypothetical protein